MPESLLAAAAVALMIPCLFLIPLGLPGTWLMLVILALGVAAGEVSLWILGILVGLAAAAEVAEFLIVRRAARRYGASNRAFWGAIAGGFLGVVIGLPIPVVGPLVAGIAGTFAGAAAVAWWETRHLPSSGRAAMGAVIGRAFAAAAKSAVGVAILVVGGTALLWR